MQMKRKQRKGNRLCFLEILW